MTTATTTTFASLILAVVASTTILGFAAAPAVAGAVKVQVLRSELATPAGRAAVDARIQAAADRACHYGGVSELALRPSKADCMAVAIETARTQVATFATQNQLAAR